jgi:hypothetical protein
MTVPLKAARAVRGTRKSAPARRRPPAPLPPEGTEARRQRDAIDAIKADRQPEPEPAAEPVTKPAVEEPTSPPPASPGGGPSLPAVPASVSTGSGFALGVFVWAAGLAYLQHGSDGLKKFLGNKFFNKG